jgi:hypothetical protein
MKNVRGMKVWGLALVAMLLFSGIAAASASAAKPEFKSPGGFPVKFTASSGAGKLETIAGRTVNCKSDTATGEVTGAKTVGNVVVKFNECTTVAFGITFNCGTITTNTLKAEPNYLTNPNSSTEVGLDLKPASGTEFAKFTCTSVFGNETLAVAGSVVGKMSPTNKLTKESTLTFTQTAGKQKYEGYFVGSTFTKDTLETTGTGLMGFGPEQSAIESTDTIKTEKEVELSA